MAESNRKAYILGPGGTHGRVGPNGLEIYAPGDLLWLTDKEAENPHLRERLTLATDAKAAELREAAAIEKLKKVAAGADATADNVTTESGEKDWSFVRSSSAAELQKLIQTMGDPDELDRLKEVEMGRGGGKRAAVRNAVAKRKRQLGAIRAQAAKKAKAAAAEAAAAEDAEVDEDDEEAGNE